MTSKEALEELLYYANLHFKNENIYKTEFANKIEQMGISDNKENFKIIEKELKALEIIKTKNVDIFFLINSCDEVDKYNEEIIDNTMYYCYSNCRKLTQEEFDLLKEVLENE